MKKLSLSISSFCKTGSGTTPSRSKYDRYFGGGIPWVKSGELRESIISNSEETITEEALAETALKIAPKGAILVAMYGANVGRVGILDIDATTNQAICHIVPEKDKADSRYIFHALQQKLPEFISRSVGGAQPNISQQIIRDTKIFGMVQKKPFSGDIAWQI
jgi:type I restriction enzyme, S subunit